MRSIKCVRNLKSLECEVYVDVYILTICGLSPRSPWLVSACLCKAGTAEDVLIVTISCLLRSRTSHGDATHPSDSPRLDRNQPWFDTRPGYFWAAYILNKSNECHTFGTFGQFYSTDILKNLSAQPHVDTIYPIRSVLYWARCNGLASILVRSASLSRLLSVTLCRDSDNYNTGSCLGHIFGHCLMLWCLMPSHQKLLSRDERALKVGRAVMPVLQINPYKETLFIMVIFSFTIVFICCSLCAH